MKKQVFNLSKVEGIPSPMGRARVGVEQKSTFTLSEVDSSSPNKGRLGGVSIGNNCKSIPIPTPSLIREGSAKLAFTLAEVLITLGVIGVVSAITMPTLIQKHQEQVTVTKVKKMYSILSQAYQMAINEKGTPDTWEGCNENSTARECSEAVYNIMKPYLKVMKECGYSDGCFADGKYKQLNGTDWFTFHGEDVSRYMFELADGSAIAFLHGYSTGIVMYYDINGTKAPNTAGKDLFQFDVSTENLYKVTPTKGTNISYCYTYGLGCTYLIIANENMDYLHCNDLQWEGKTKCK